MSFSPRVPRLRCQTAIVLKPFCFLHTGPVSQCAQALSGLTPDTTHYSVTFYFPNCMFNADPVCLNISLFSRNKVLKWDTCLGIVCPPTNCILAGTPSQSQLGLEACCCGSFMCPRNPLYTYTTTPSLYTIT